MNMGEQSKKIIPLRSEPVQPADSEMLVTLTVSQLRQIIADTIASRAGHESLTLIDADTLAEKLSIPVSWVYEQSRQGAIPTHRVGKYIRFDLNEVLESQRKND